MQIIFLVRVPESTAAVADDVLPISATVELNQDSMWVGFTDMTVVDEADQINVVVRKREEVRGERERE